MPTWCWPLHGLVHILLRPRLWWYPVAASLLSALLALGLALGVGTREWPSSDASAGSWIFHACVAIGLAAAAGSAAWMLGQPLLMGLGLQRLVRRILPADLGGKRPRPMTALDDIAATVLTLPLRIGWPLAAMAMSLIAGPAGLVIAALGLSHLAVFDASEMVLAMGGLDRGARHRARGAHRGVLAVGILVGTMLALVCGLSIVGWLLFPAAMVCGMGLLVVEWPELSVAPASGTAH